MLKGENGSVSKHMSRKILIEFNDTQRDAFERLRNILASEDVILMYPDFKKPFDLTTDASANGIGAVLSQEVLQIRDDIIAECDDGIFAVSDCELTSYATFCKKSTRESCAREIHAGGVANCRTQPSHLLPVALIDEGTIVINEQHVQVTVDEGPMVMLKGTHLITFEHVAIINNTRYLNYNAVVGKSPSIATSPLLNITGHDQILSLSSIHRMSEQNINIIRQLKDEVEAGGSPKDEPELSSVNCSSIISVAMFRSPMDETVPPSATLASLVTKVAHL
ncbi:hypothetical protein KR044_001666 [Drosophila immigrans]|nr:hypothetical protein KR044_001666 [Drosophila immigrans]